MANGFLTPFEKRALDFYLDENQNKDKFQNVPTHNTLIKTLPTRVAKPYDNLEVVSYSSADSTVSLGDDKYDPSAGLPMAKVTIPSGNTAWHTVTYEDVPAIEMDDFDVWMTSVYVPDIKSTIEVEIQISPGPVIGGDYRTFAFTVADRQINRGYNLLTCLHNESKIFLTQYNVFRTHIRQNWDDVGTATKDDSVRSIAVRCRTVTAEAADTEVYLGNVFTAPQGWAKGVVCWAADDVQESFIDLAGPVIESYGWKYNLSITSMYAADPPGNPPGANGHAPISRIFEVKNKGHEIWGHCRRHENMDTEDTAGKTKAIIQANAYWRGIGIESASRFMSWPGGNFDDEAISIVKNDNMLLAASVSGDEINPYMVGVNPYNLNRFSIDRANSWQIDTQINGCALRGTMIFAYGHGVLQGAPDDNVSPGPNRIYVEHLKRWCDRVKEYEEDGKLVVTTPLRYLRMCGIDPDTHNFLE